MISTWWLAMKHKFKLSCSECHYWTLSPTTGEGSKANCENSPSKPAQGQGVGGQGQTKAISTTSPTQTTTNQINNRSSTNPHPNSSSVNNLNSTNSGNNATQQQIILVSILHLRLISTTITAKEKKEMMPTWLCLLNYHRNCCHTISKQPN